MVNVPKIVVAARPYDISDACHDAFVERHTALVSNLTSRFDVDLVALRQPSDTDAVSNRFSDLKYSEVQLGSPPSSRGARISVALRRTVDKSWKPWEHELERVVASANADAAVTIGPWLDDEYRVLNALLPTVHLFEEDLTQMHELAPQSRQAMALRAFERRAKSRSAAPPSVVVAISAPELERARMLFRRSRHFLLPFFLVDETWVPQRGPNGGGSYVLVVGNMSEARNSEGLVETLGHLRSQRDTDPIPVRIVSDAGIHKGLDPLMGEPWVQRAPRGADLRDEYIGARLVLVPAKRVTGFKTTVLQGWAMERAVVCFPASADSLGHAGRGAVHVGRDASEVAAGVVRLWSSTAERDALAHAGRRRVVQYFRREVHERRFLELVDDLVSGAPSSNSRKLLSY
jgi:glycosyltransferase involved in cell wall biosynthesis